jgi:two-component system sensor histidine kinase KdpD
MSFIRSSSLLDHFIAVIILSFVTALFYLLDAALSTNVIALLYLLPIGLIAWRFGFGASMVSSVLAFFALNFFFIPPRFTFHVSQWQDWIVLFVLLIESSTISYWVNRAQTSLAEARARERETTHLYELSISLAGLRSEEDIAYTIAEHLKDVFEADRVDVLTFTAPHRIVKTYRIPKGDAVTAAPPTHPVQLITPRGLLGEIRLWQLASPLQPKDDPLLNAFASISALALERVTLANVESRSKILEESDRLKSSLLSSVSHELRTPLATIKAAATSLRSGEVEWGSLASQDLIAAIDEETDQLNRLVGNLLDMSRIESGALKPNKQWDTLSDIVNAALSHNRRALENHLLEVDVSDDLPLVAVDHSQIDQVLTNLLSNSAKYAPRGTIIRIHARPNVDFTMMNVQLSNAGPHVPDEHLTHIFDKFYRVTAADRVTGTGLGLSICKGIIEAHGGHIWAQNIPKGFAFNFTLPLMWDGARPKSVK